MPKKIIDNGILRIFAGSGKNFLIIENGNSKINILPPIFEIDYKTCGDSKFEFNKVFEERSLKNNGFEFVICYRIKELKDIILKVFLRYFPESPVIRFKYVLHSNNSIKMTKLKGCDNIRYCGITINSNQINLTEIQFSQYDSIKHCYIPQMETYENIDSNNYSSNFIGPILLAAQKGNCCLLAYEHGSEYPDSFLSFNVKSLKDKIEICLNASKGNYYDGQKINSSEHYETPWFHFAVVNENKDFLLRRYREFFLKFISENSESREPYIYYNTWNYQERVKIFKNGKYLDSINLDHILKEIDIAHEIGIDVFVIDTGWYIKTGEWCIDENRFPDKLKRVKERLNYYGMKLGLWFNPIAAAKTSEIYLQHPEYAMSRNNEICNFGRIWETEESYGMCMVSGYSDYFIKKLIQLNQELGVIYFKWDGVGQYGCDSPNHFHGTKENTTEERRDNYSFKMGLEMIKIVEQVTKECPDVIFDFDITESGRFVGLGFLSVGKYFHMNNGPYFSDFDIPKSIDINPNTVNVFFHKGVARSRVCRQNLQYDKFIPSILFLSHFYPDKEKISQNNSLSSLMLGGNGIWGDLLSLDNEDIKLFRENINRYKKVASSVTESYPITRGFIGSSPEIYEKISHRTSSGIVTFFTRTEGNYSYITQKIDVSKLDCVEGADLYSITDDSRILIEVSLKMDEARTVFVLSKK